VCRAAGRRETLSRSDAACGVVEVAVADAVGCDCDHCTTQRVGLVIIDEIHLLGEDRGPILEVIVSRMRYIASQVDTHIRIMGLSTALANAGDLAEWLGIDRVGLYNFRPSVRPVPMEVHIQVRPVA
jgi:replicative superfamily II helicase